MALSMPAATGRSRSTASERVASILIEAAEGPEHAHGGHGDEPLRVPAGHTGRQGCGQWRSRGQDVLQYIGSTGKSGSSMPPSPR